MIEVRQTRGGDPYEFEVTIREGGSETRHRVTMDGATHASLAGDEEVAPDRLVHAAFEFLLDREPKESILRSFDVTVISKYFPEFEREIGNYL